MEFTFFTKERDAGWDTATSWEPVNLSWVMRHGSDGPCTISFDIPFSQYDASGGVRVHPRSTQFVLSLGTPAPFAPYDGNQIMTGLISQTSLGSNEQVIHVQGKDYLWDLQGRIYPYDYSSMQAAALSNAIFNEGTDISGLFGDPTPSDIITDLFTAINGNTFIDPTWIYIWSLATYGPNFTAEAFDGFPLLQVLPGDLTSIADMIAQMAGQELSMGFEYFVDSTADYTGILGYSPDVFPLLYIFSNRYQTSSLYDPIDLEHGLMNLDITDNSPVSTHEVGFGLNKAMSSDAYADSGTLDSYGLIEHSTDFGDYIRSQPRLDDMTLSELARFKGLQSEWTVTMKVEDVPVTEGSGGVFIQERAGVLLTVVNPFSYYDFDDVALRATELQFNVSNEGEVTCVAPCEYLIPD